MFKVCKCKPQCNGALARQEPWLCSSQVLALWIVHGDGIPVPINGVQPAQQVVQLPADQNAQLAAGDQLSVPNVSAAQLTAVGFVEPTLHDGTHTGHTVEFVIAQNHTHTATVGQYFSLDGSNDGGSMRALIDLRFLSPTLHMSL